MPRFDWPVLMQAGVHGLGLKPAEFWQLIPAEFALMLAPSGARTMTRSGFETLMAAYPDTEEGSQHG